MRPAREGSMVAERDAIAMLEDDHRRVESLFDRFQSGSGDDREQAAVALAEELTLHAAVEEQVVYPELRSASKDVEGIVEHSLDELGEIKRLADQIRATAASDPALDGLVTELKNIVMDHVRDEETLVFVELRDALDEGRLAALGVAVERARELARVSPGA